MKRTDDRIREEIFHRVAAGETRKALAIEYGVSRETVRRIAMRAGNEERKRKRNAWEERFMAAWANIYPGDAKRSAREMKKVYICSPYRGKI